MSYSAQWAIVLLILLMPFPVHAWPARVVAVTDGDTLDVEPAAGGDRIRVRLHGIDAPELRQSHGQAARDFVIKAVLFREVEVVETPQRRDRYGRTIAVVVFDGRGLQAELLKAGLAWVWPRYCRNCSEWQALQDEARGAGRGLWQEPDPIPPWLWRKRSHPPNLKVWSGGVF